MSDAQAQNEPTMEEILSSIRRIISEDDEPEAPPPPAEEPAAEDPAPEEEAPKTVEEILSVVKGKQGEAGSDEAFSDTEDEPEPEPEREPEPEPEPEEEDILDLDEFIGEDELPGGEDDDVGMVEPPAPPPQMPPAPATDLERLISDHTAADASASLAALAQQVTAQRDIAVPTFRTLEDITKELLRPMLKEWLDANLPSIVQRIVEREVAKLAGEVDDNKR